ncbi:COG1361 S-layer family protein [Bifidobacterium moukalabense]|uniref:COG1361 S-layer family protein n=1 Tax=Bifidobacterium moukalabense TaxID=1333651 RepID=UPI0010F4D759|nr:ABC transporter permease [Bifidobacterium moukalabense]
MTNTNRKTRFVNLLIATVAAVVIMLTCMVPHAFAMAGGAEYETAQATAGQLADTSVDGGIGSNGAINPVNESSDGNGGGSEQIAGPVPNIIITNFTYGDGSVSVGSNFNLDFTFQNMGKVAVQNMVVTVDGGENFAISGGTNTFYFDSLWAGYSLTQSVPMQALSGAKSGAQGITVSFKYEYVDNNVRSSSSSDIKISVPVSQPDRFQLSDPVLPDTINAGEETTITMAYVNKGKGDISNVEASIEGDGITSTQATQYIGNVASGASGSIGFAFTPNEAAETEAKLRVTYEDSDGQSQTREFPVTFTAQEAARPDINDGMTPDDGQNQQGVPVWVWVVVAIVVIVAIILTVVLVRRHKKTKKHGIDEDWDDWEAGSPADSVAKDAAAAASVATDEAPTQMIAPADSASADSAKGQA